MDQTDSRLGGQKNTAFEDTEAASDVPAAEYADDGPHHHITNPLARNPDNQWPNIATNTAANMAANNGQIGSSVGLGLRSGYSTPSVIYAPTSTLSQSHAMNTSARVLPANHNLQIAAPPALEMGSIKQALSPPAYNGVDSTYAQSQDVEKQEEQEETNDRGNWGGQLEFILTCVGYAVGLGNIWRFPYLVYKNGGGAFLIPYTIMLLIVGIPLFFLELSFGQFASLGPITIWQINPMLKGLGYAMVICNTMIALYYNVIIAWAIYYFFSSMTLTLPWTDCGNDWNTDNCFTNKYLRNNCTGNTTWWSCEDGREVLKANVKSPSEEYFYERMLGISSGIEEMGSVQWPLALCLLMAWALVFIVLIRGIGSLGKVVYFSSLFPYVLLTIMLIRGVTLPGAMLGIKFYLTPDFSKLTNVQVWSDAATQVFYSTSACTGGLIVMASYNKFNNNCKRDSILVPLVDLCTSVYAGFAIFSMLGFMAQEKGVSVAEVAETGPGLVFIVYPEGLSQMPAPPVWAMLFFFMLVNLGFSSEFSLAEGFFGAVIDEFSGLLRRTRRINVTFRLLCTVAAFCITLPMVTQGGFYLVNLVDTTVGGFPLLIIAVLEPTVIAYIYGFNRFSEDIEMMLGSKPGIFFKATWCVITPGIILLLIVFVAIQYEDPTMFEDYHYPGWALSLGWIIVVMPLIFIPGVFVYRLLKDGGIQIIREGVKPSADWGPALSCNKIGKYKPQSLTHESTIKNSASASESIGQQKIVQTEL